MYNTLFFGSSISSAPFPRHKHLASHYWRCCHAAQGRPPQPLGVFVLDARFDCFCPGFIPPATKLYRDGKSVLGDFNADGKPDLLSSDGTLIGKSNGSFSAGTPVSGAPLPVADFNGDGKLDILEQSTKTLLVLLGNGDGTFQALVSSAPTNYTLTSIVAADLNGDGKADVIGIFNSMALVYQSNGNGSFA
jgi:hypothetical protein